MYFENIYFTRLMARCAYKWCNILQGAHCSHRLFSIYATFALSI